MRSTSSLSLSGTLTCVIGLTTQWFREVVGILVIVLVASFVLNAAAYAAVPNMHVASQHDKWTADQSFGFTVYIALNFKYGRTRDVYLLMDSHNFTEGDLRKVFTGLSDRFSDSVILEITAFSDEAMLERAVNMRKSGVFVDFANTPEGVEAQRKWYEAHEPLPTGYFRAYYNRSEKKEGFRYSPDPNKEDYKTIKLNHKAERTVQIIRGGNSRSESRLAQPCRLERQPCQ